MSRRKELPPAERVRLYLLDEKRVRRYGRPVHGTAKDEYRPAAPYRDWRCDYTYPHLMLIIEVEGATFGAKSRHTTGTGYADDCRKYSALALLGWLVIRIAEKQLTDGDAYDLIDAALEQRRLTPPTLIRGLDIPAPMVALLARIPTSTRPRKAATPKATAPKAPRATTRGKPALYVT